MWHAVFVKLLLAVLPLPDQAREGQEEESRSGSQGKQGLLRIGVAVHVPDDLEDEHSHQEPHGVDLSANLPKQQVLLRAKGYFRVVRGVKVRHFSLFCQISPTQGGRPPMWRAVIVKRKATIKKINYKSPSHKNHILREGDFKERGILQGP
jgi:hypothetical protein